MPSSVHDPPTGAAGLVRVDDSDDGVDELQDSEEFYIPDQMPSFRPDAIRQYTTVELSEMCHMGEIDLSPEYQRGEHLFLYLR